MKGPEHSSERRFASSAWYILLFGFVALFRMALIPFAQTIIQPITNGTSGIFNFISRHYHDLCVDIFMWIKTLFAHTILWWWPIIHFFGNKIIPILMFPHFYFHETQDIQHSQRRFNRYLLKRKIPPDKILSFLDGRQYHPIFDRAITIRPEHAYHSFRYVISRSHRAMHLSYIRYDITSNSIRSWLHKQQYPPEGYITSAIILLVSILVFILQMYYGFQRICQVQQNETISFASSDNSSKSSPEHQAYFLVQTSLSTKESVDQLHPSRTNFDYDSYNFVVDNCANVHIINDPDLFHSFQDMDQRCVATIGGQDLKPTKVGMAMIRSHRNNANFSILSKF